MSSTTLLSAGATPSYNPKNPNNLIPAIPPPPGVVSNFIDPDSLWRWDVLCMTVCLFFTTVPFVLRCYVRAFIKREWLLEDYMTCLGWAGFVTYCALVTTVMNRHGGVHEWDVTLEEVKEVFYWFNVTTIEYGVAQVTVKLAILMFYRRIFLPRRHSAFDIFLRVCEVSIVGFYFAITTVKIFECKPRERIWDRSIPGTCVDIGSLLNASGFFNLLTDTIVLLIPVRCVWNLKMKRKKKLMVISVFTVGSIAPIFSTIGIVIRFELFNDPDATYFQPEVLLWAAAEVCTGLICLCLPPLSILLKQSRRRGPTPSILAGDSSGRQFSSGQHSGIKRKTGLNGTDEELLTSEYELKNGSPGIGIAIGNYPSADTVQRPANAHIYSGDHHHAYAHAHAHAHADPAAYAPSQDRSEKRTRENWIDDDNESGELGSPERADMSALSYCRAEGDRSNGRGLHGNQTGIVKTVEIEQSYI